MLFVITHKSLMPSVKVKAEFDLVNKFHREIENQQKYLLPAMGPACMPLHGYKFIPCACSYRAPSLVSSSIQDFIIGAVAHSSVIITSNICNYKFIQNIRSAAIHSYSYIATYNNNNNNNIATS